MVVRLSAAALACRPHVLVLLMVGRSTVIRLRFRGVHISFGGSRLIEVVRVNLLLSVGRYREKGQSTDCEH